ncbi:MAG TPA: hypothetical protein VHZ24_15335 [Pirellulales bacterium]|jgi:lipopolysaccharide export system protein LptA|nr:hypothetical protein [Pirellulales bacterium]
MPEFKRIKRIGSSFAIVLACYAVYGLAAVPLIEPETELPDSSTGIMPQNYADRQRQWLQGLFLEGDWERTSPKVLETGQGILLVKSYRNLPDGRMALNPCTVIFLSENKNLTPEQQWQQAIVLRAPEGAVLQFDSGSDLRQAKIGKVVAGDLKGPVTIRSDNKQPGPEDDLLIHTTDVQLNQQMIWTSKAVDFQLGTNRGRGRRLQIDLAHENETTAFRGMTSLELTQEVEMRLDAGQSAMMPGSARRGEKKPAPAKQQPPVEVRCKGPFRFDFVKNLAEYHDQVDVTRMNPTGPSDQMACELLKVFFESADDQKQPRSEDSDSLRLKASRMEATGNPVVVLAPSNHVQARGRELEYNVATGAVTLRDHREAHVHQLDKEIHAATIYACPDAAGQLSEFRATGPGSLHGTMDEARTRPFAAQWTRGIHFRPHDGQQVLSIEGSAKVDAPGQGTLTGEEIHVWLRKSESPAGGAPKSAGAAKPQGDLQPDRMQAVGNVVIDSAQLTANVDRLQGWFEPAPAAQAAPAGPQAAEELPPPPGAKPAPAEPKKPAPPPTQRFHVVGQEMRLRSRNNQGRSELAELVIDHRVRLTEVSSEKIEGKPLLVTGDQLHLTSPAEGRELVRVSGLPAYVEARELTLASDSIFLDRGENRLWTETLGTMTVATEKGLDGSTDGAKQPLEVHWQGRMNFDGLTARFERLVVARQPPHELHTELLDAVFTRRVDFAKQANQRPAQGGAPDDGSRPEIERIICRQGAIIDSRTIEGQTLTSVDRIQLIELTVEQLTGDVFGTGPGIVTSVRAGGHEEQNEQKIDAAAVDGRKAKAAELTYMNIDFQRTMRGNMRRHEMRFEGQVVAVYGPVAAWDETIDVDRPETWPPKTMGVSSERMTVAELPPVEKDKKNYELIAEGNALAEGTTFTARAARMTYAQAKDLLVLEGSDRTPARLFRQVIQGTAPSQADARKILYWPSTNRAEIDGARYLDFNQLPGMPTK